MQFIVSFLPFSSWLLYLKKMYVFFQVAAETKVNLSPVAKAVFIIMLCGGLVALLSC